MSDISTKPYLLRAIYEWCTDSGFTPYIAVKVDAGTTVPMEYVKGGEIVLNISFGATNGLKMDNDAVHFHARFAGVSREIYVPVHNVMAIYANENGQGMAFDVTGPAPTTSAPRAPEEVLPALTPAGLAAVPSIAPVETAKPVTPAPDDDNDPPRKGPRPTLTRIK